jgi:hypothetical protein
VNEVDLLRHLLELADEAQITIRHVPGASEGGGALSSAVCRVRGRAWVVLSGADPPGRRIEVLAAALREHAAGFLEGRYLAPAVRERLSPDGPEGEAG